MNKPMIDNELFKVGQIRLHELSVYNWGSFHGLHTAKIDPVGTLITGDNGSGKTTFIDGLMALLLPAGRASFNVAAAQGDRSDRTLLSYMRGNFGSAHDGNRTKVKSKRNQSVITGLRACYLADEGNYITLAVLFWAAPSATSSADINRHYVIANRNLQLKELLEYFRDGERRLLKQRLNNDATIAYSNDNFSDYQALYRKLLHMDNKNTPALLSRALGLKKIDDLTALIRELVLEPSEIKEEARKVVKEFADLETTHAQLLDAKEQQRHLIKLPELNQKYNNCLEISNNLEQEKNGLTAYFGELKCQLYTTKLQQLQKQIDHLQHKLDELNQNEQELESQVENYHAAYLLAGGESIEPLKKQRKHVQLELERVNLQASKYQKETQTLGLNPELVRIQFENNQQLATEKLQNLKQDTQNAQDRFGHVSGELSNLQAQLNQTQEQITGIKARPDSNIALKFQQLRDEMVASLNLTIEQCRFIGELINVKESESDWQGAIERALGGLRTTMIVPYDVFSQVTRWLNTRHTGLHVRVQVVPELFQHQKIKAEFKPEGYLNKLIWRNHPYRDWLKKHLQRFDLTCVDSTEELDKTPFSITQAGLTHLEQGRFEKKDQNKINDQTVWQLGFSNKARLAILEQELTSLTQKIEAQEQIVQQKRKDLDKIEEQKQLWQKLQNYCWEEIDLPRQQAKLSRIEKELAELLQNGNDLNQAQLRWETAKANLQQLHEQELQLKQEQGSRNNELENTKRELQRAQDDADQGIEHTVRQLLNHRIGQYNNDILPSLIKKQSFYLKQIEDSLKEKNQENEKTRDNLIRVMSYFKSHWSIIANDWATSITSIEDYITHLLKLEQEGLPQLQERFKERLNKHATESLARIQQQLDAEKNEIKERIQVINTVLKRTEFRKNTYLKLNTKNEQYPNVIEFSNLLKIALSLFTSDDHERRFETLKEIVTKLDKASNTASANTLESLRLLDPRYQMSFFAEELDNETAAVIDVLESSSGKSGGEKESFAGAIVAASLAYALTPDGHDKPVYCTVFLDEAFSNTAETVSRRVLNVFKALHIHINLITPYKNLNLARETARSLLIAERNQQTHESHLCEVTWEEIDTQLTQIKNPEIIKQAQSLGIELTPIKYT
ncbi:ATP-binding protein [Snodgrassella communis]|uniref:Uncharacterized protein n=1 Tax=Snodgrassella alvi TaxID=1196083 RepID=A0A2N9XWT4_9NEIS|nr:ATP-binding protein [Snodgrassella communis]PIT54239.1 hypothetical protein BHC48_00710 [Snodgrassella communis]